MPPSLLPFVWWGNNSVGQTHSYTLPLIFGGLLVFRHGFLNDLKICCRHSHPGICPALFVCDGLRASCRGHFQREATDTILQSAKSVCLLQLKDTPEDPCLPVVQYAHSHWGLETEVGVRMKTFVDKWKENECGWRHRCTCSKLPLYLVAARFSSCWDGIMLQQHW